MTSREVGDSLFRATELVMIVIFAVLLTTVSATLIEAGLHPATYLVAAVMLLFIEAYLILDTYHRRLSQPYDLTFFGFDLVLLALFVTLVRMFEASIERPDLLSSGLWLGLILFGLLYLRQLGSYTRAKNNQEQLAAADLTKAELLTPMVADFVGVAACGAILMAKSDSIPFGSVEVWSGMGLAAAILYFVVKYLLVVRITFGRLR